jgi:hypothetical protein
LAAFFEGFVTRHTEMPVWLSSIILVLSAAIIIWYFTIYPLLLKRSGLKVIKGKIIFPTDA